MEMMCIKFFFFQAEGGIQDGGASLGLGDEYKRQGYGGPPPPPQRSTRASGGGCMGGANQGQKPEFYYKNLDFCVKSVTFHLILLKFGKI